MSGGKSAWEVCTLREAFDKKEAWDLLDNFTWWLCGVYRGRISVDSYVCENGRNGCAGLCNSEVSALDIAEAVLESSGYEDLVERVSAMFGDGSSSRNTKNVESMLERMFFTWQTFGN